MRNEQRQQLPQQPQCNKQNVMRSYFIEFKTFKNIIMNILKLFKKRKTEEERIKEWHNSDLYKNSESIKKYWTPELIEWIGNETNPVTLAVASCLLNSWCYPSFMPSNPGDYSKAHENDLILSYFISDLMKTLEIKSEKLCPGLYKKIWISNYYDRFRS